MSEINNLPELKEKNDKKIHLQREKKRITRKFTIT